MANGENMTHVGAWYRSVTCCRSHTDCTWQLRLYWTVTCKLRALYFCSFYAYQGQYFTIPCQETFVLKCCLLSSTAANIHPDYMLFLIIWNQTLIHKEQLKSHSEISFAVQYYFFSIFYRILHIFTHNTGYFWSYETKHWSLKGNLNLILKCHKLTRISFIKINMKHDPEWNPD